MYDLAISNHGDLIMAASRDLGGVSGTDLLDQRVMLRLTIHRGTWYYDLDQTLGSNLYHVLGTSPDSALEIDAYVREALRPMDQEISIEDILPEYDSDTKALSVQVTYSQIIGGPGDDINLPGSETQSTVTVPIMPGER